MKPVECEFEAEALAAAVQSRWPERVDPELRAHMSGCPICADVVTVAGAIESAGETARASALVPDSGRVWWMAQMRARREAAKAAGRPITAAQVLAVACSAGVLGACFGATSNWFQAALAKTGAVVSGLDLNSVVPGAVALVADHAALAMAAAAVVVLVPVAVFAAVMRD